MAYEQTKTDDWCIPGLELSHDLDFVLHDWNSWGAFEGQLTARGGRVHSLTMRRQSTGVLVRCRVRGISANQAREVGAWLGANELAANVSVEHLMLAGPDGS